MPIVRDFRLELSNDDVVRREGGSRAKRLRPAIQRITDELLATAEGEGLLQPAIAFARVPIAAFRDDRITLRDGRVVEGRILVTRFRGAEELAAVMCTLGPRLDTRVQACHAGHDDLRALLLDGIGCAAMDALGRECCRLVGQAAEGAGMRATGALSPGIHGIPMSDQRVVHDLVGAGEIGITLTDGLMMTPNKSASMLFGLGREMAEWSKEQVCEWCNLSQSCAYRVSA